MAKRTTMILPEALLEAAKRVSGKATQTEAVCEALTTYVARKGTERLIAAQGKFPHLQDLRVKDRALYRKRERLLERLRRR
jgi:hypothetical protein